MPSLLSLLKWSPLSLVPVGAGVVALWPAQVTGERAGPGAVTVEVLGVGTLESARTVPVAFEVGGRVAALTVDEGDTVTLGAPLGALERDLARHDLDASVAGVTAARQDVVRAEADLARARATAELARTERARTATLFAAGDVTASARDVAEERAHTADAAVSAAEATLGRARASLAAATSGERARAVQVADGDLASPLDGLVVTRHVEVGQVVAAGTPAFTVVDTAALEVRAWVDESALARLEVGQPARLVFRSEPDRSYPGRVARIGREVDRSTHELLVDVTVLEPPKNFAVGQRADAWIALDERAAAVTAPRGWCADTCRVAVGGWVVEKPVTLGLVGRDRVEVREGLAVGDVLLPPDAPRRGLVRAEVP